MTWMNKYNVASIIQDYLATTNQMLTYDEIVVLAKQIRKPMWNWHIYIGYILVGLISLRFSLSAFGVVIFQNPFLKKLQAKKKFQYWIYLFFYTFITISLVTGLIIEFGPKTMKKPIEEIHVLSIYYLIAYLLIHFGGVLIAEFTNEQGIISKMISGNIKKEENILPQ
jgi:cytochrome b561